MIKCLSSHLNSCEVTVLAKTSMSELKYTLEMVNIVQQEEIPSPAPHEVIIWLQ